MADDPKGASNVSYNMEVVVRSNKNSVKLRAQNMKTLFKDIHQNAHVVVKGRVERLENDESDNDSPQCEMIKFKLVVDSDHHMLVYLARQTPKCDSQMVQPWWIQDVGDRPNKYKLKVGNRIPKATGRIFCDSTVSDDEIINYVVALKNCSDGDILVGVNKEGEVTGRTYGDGEAAKWQEKISMAITSILPDSKDGGNICSNLEETCNLDEERQCFVYMFSLSENKGKGPYIPWIHVPKGEKEPIYFRKERDVHAFVRKGAENKRITNYVELFDSLCSLGSRPKPKEISSEDLHENTNAKIKEANGETGLGKTYEILDEVRLVTTCIQFIVICSRPTYLV